jgi:hypothetical protein
MYHQIPTQQNHYLILTLVFTQDRKSYVTGHYLTFSLLINYVDSVYFITKDLLPSYVNVHSYPQVHMILVLLFNIAVTNLSAQNCL